MKKNIYKLNNNIYLKEKKKVKEYFKKIYLLIKKNNKNKKISIVDVGCASGDFLSFLKSRIKIDESFGIDYSKLLIKKGKRKSDFKFINKDISKNFDISKKFDFVTCLGTLSIFDDITTPLNNIFRLSKKGGFIFIFDIVNDHDVNVLMRYQNRKVNEKKWYSAFNYISKKDYIKKIKKINPKSKIKLLPFNININIKKTNNPMVAWTTKINNKTKIIVGTNQILNFNIISIKNL